MVRQYSDCVNDIQSILSSDQGQVLVTVMASYTSLNQSVLPVKYPIVNERINFVLWRLFLDYPI
jgi:hypothetical protein